MADFRSEEHAVAAALAHAGVSRQDVVSGDDLGIITTRAPLTPVCYYRLRRPVRDNGGEIEYVGLQIHPIASNPHMNHEPPRRDHLHIRPVRLNNGVLILDDNGRVPNCQEHYYWG